MREPSQPPPEFVSYVDKRLHALESAALRLTGDEIQAERIARELMTLTALRWQRLARADARHGLDSGQSADAHLMKLFRQEADDFGYPQTVLNLHAAVPGRRRSALAGNLSAIDEATILWEAARRRLRRRLLIAVGVGGVIAVAALCRRGGSDAESQPESQLEPPLAQSTELPQGALIMPADGLAFQKVGWLPEQLALPRESPALSSSPIPRAVLLAGSPHVADGRMYALADDGSWRHVDGAPPQAARWMDAGALSPDGRRAVVVTANVGMIVDISTGQAQTIPGIAGPTKPVWLSAQQLLLSKAAMLDLDTGKLVPAPSGPQDAVASRGRELGDRTSTLMELLSIGQPLTAPARVRRWTLTGDDSHPVTIALGGQLAGVVGRWQGGGFGFGDDRVARLCLPGAIPGSTPVNTIVAVVTPKSGEVVKALLVNNTISGAPELIGWQDERRVLLTMARGATQQIVAWDLLADRVTRGCAMDFVGVVALRDLTRVA